MSAVRSPKLVTLPLRGSADARMLFAVALIVCAVAAIRIGWIGYMSSDDTAYYLGALRWLAQPPFAGDNHWTTRHPLEITLAAAIGVVGRGYAAMAVVALCWYAAFILTFFWLARRIVGERAAWLATMIMATLPVVVGNATTVSCDLTEAVFLMLGIGLAGDLAAGDRSNWRAAGAGVAFATAILCRETTALALFGFAPMFLRGRPIARRSLLVMAIAALGLLGLEAFYQWALTGDPLNRWSLAFHHDSHIDRAANAEGNFLLWAPIDPLLVLLVNDDFALLFWAVGGALVFGFQKRLDPPARARLLVLFALAVSSFVMVSVLYTKLVLNPRYFMLAAICGGVVVGAWLDQLRAVWRVAILTAIIGADLLLLGLGNGHPHWNGEALLLAGRGHPGETIHTDNETLGRAKYRMAWEHVRNASAGGPAPGMLYLTDAGSTPACAAIVQRFASPPTFWGAAVERLGVEERVPGAVARRLLHPSPEMVLVRVAPPSPLRQAGQCAPGAG